VGVSQAKEEEHRRIVDAVHPADPESKPEAEPNDVRRTDTTGHPAKPEPDPEFATAEEEFLARLLAPKPGHVELIRSVHPDE
jgi:hypothetical protein